jgi:hypothetical protein
MSEPLHDLHNRLGVMRHAKISGVQDDQRFAFWEGQGIDLYSVRPIFGHNDLGCADFVAYQPFLHTRPKSDNRI